MRMAGAIGILLLSIRLAAAGDISEKPFNGDYRYEDAERMTFFDFHGSSVISDFIKPRGASNADQKDIEEVLGFVAMDCSNAEFRCIDGGSFVLAVPTGPLRPNASFMLLGAKISVVECLRGSGRACQVALIETDCQNRPTLTSCGTFPGGRAKAPRMGDCIYFIYNEDYGITSFGPSYVKGQASIDYAQKTARRFILRGDRGLLN